MRNELAGPSAPGAQYLGVDRLITSQSLGLRKALSRGCEQGTRDTEGSGSPGGSDEGVALESEELTRQRWERAAQAEGRHRQGARA